MKEIRLLVFDRDKIDDVFCILPGGERRTKKEEINMIIAEHGHWWGRKDLAMVTLWDATERPDNRCMQLIVEPTQSGMPCFGDAAMFLTKKEKKELIALNKRLLKIEKEEGWPVGTLSGF